MITITELTKQYKTGLGIDNISFSLKSGKILGIIGYSGGGKTTLLNCICGLLNFDSGIIKLQQQQLTGQSSLHSPERVLYRRHIGVVYQQLFLFPHLTVTDNIIEAPVTLNRCSKTEASNKADMLLKRFGLTHKKDEYPVNLSGGEQQRVAIARAVVMEPNLLLLDEPTSALDPLRSSDIRNFLKEYISEGRSVIIVSHSISFLKDLADELLFIESGKLIEHGPTKDMLNAPQNEKTAHFLSHS